MAKPVEPLSCPYLKRHLREKGTAKNTENGMIMVIFVIPAKAGMTGDERPISSQKQAYLLRNFTHS